METGLATLILALWASARPGSAHGPETAQSPKQPAPVSAEGLVVDDGQLTRTVRGDVSEYRVLTAGSKAGDARPVVRMAYRIAG
jgi:hypothetical protein